MHCRFCCAPLHEIVVDLGRSPLSNALVDAARLDEPDAMYPLRAYVCDRCWLVQVPDVQAPARIFEDYVYFSSYSTTWLEHVRRFAHNAIARFELANSSLVLEVASNDGHLLREFANAGIPVLGVEPAANVAAVAGQAGIPTEIAFFGSATAQKLASRGSRADLIVANNVFAHVPDPNDFAEGLRIALKPKGVITLEFPHVQRILERNEFDTIYHEHFSYFSLDAARRVLAAHGLEVWDVDELPTHGGSLRVYAAHQGDRAAGARVAGVLAGESRAGLQTLPAYAAFAVKARRVRQELRAFFDGALRNGKNVAGYGAPAKATTLLNFCEIGPDQLPYTVDRSPHKQGKFVPGVRVPIASPEKILESKPDYVLVLPWNIKEEIAEQMAAVREWGGKFVVPIPNVAVL